MQCIAAGEGLTMPNDSQFVLRLPADMIARVEALVPKLGAAPSLGAFRVSRSAILRMALVRGLDELEREYSRKSPRKRR
jgi:hypothetical protein